MPDTADKPCIVAIDEFQQIAKYPEKNIEALLRTHIQKIENSNFTLPEVNGTWCRKCFYLHPVHSTTCRYFGTESHCTGNLYTIYRRPFPKKKTAYWNRKYRKSISAIQRTYLLYQKTFNEAFADTPKGKECTLEIIKTAIDNLIAYNDTIFREILSNIPEKQKELLYAIPK